MCLWILCAIIFACETFEIVTFYTLLLRLNSFSESSINFFITSLSSLCVWQYKRVLLRSNHNTNYFKLIALFTSLQNSVKKTYVLTRKALWILSKFNSRSSDFVSKQIKVYALIPWRKSSELKYFKWIFRIIAVSISLIFAIVPLLLRN